MIASIELRNIHFAYPGESNVLSDVSLDFKAGQSFRIKSTAGGGKSSLLKLIAGLLDSTSGTYLLNGHPVEKMSFEEFLPLRLKIGYSFDSGGLLNNRTIAENLRLILEYHRLLKPEAIEQRVAEFLNDFSLNDVADHRPSSVSGSQRKVACVARALINYPELLILDEPTIGLGPKAKSTLIKKVQKLKSDGYLKYLLVATDDEEFISSLQLIDFEISKVQKVAA